MKASTVAISFVLFGVAGWTIENVRRGPTFSKAFNGARIPFLPVYAFGGTAALLLSEKIADYPVWQRFLVYGISTTAVEAIAGAIDRLDGSKPSWDYDGAVVDIKYSIMWATAAIIVEQLIIKTMTLK